MNLEEKIVFGGRIGIAVGLTLMAASVGIKFISQQRTITRLNKRVDLLKDTVDLMARVALRDNTVIDDVTEHVIKYTDIPNDIRDINP